MTYFLSTSPIASFHEHTHTHIHTNTQTPDYQTHREETYCTDKIHTFSGPPNNAEASITRRKSFKNLEALLKDDEMNHRINVLRALSCRARRKGKLCKSLYSAGQINGLKKRRPASTTRGLLQVEVIKTDGLHLIHGEIEILMQRA